MTKEDKKIENIEQVIEKAKADGVDFIEIQFVDLLGVPKSVEVDKNHFDILKSNASVDGSSITGFQSIEDSGLDLKVDPNTYTILPWEGEEKFKVARVFSDVVTSNGTPYESDPRGILRRQISIAQQSGYDTFNVAPEAEFFFLNQDRTPGDSVGYWDKDPIQKSRQLRREISSLLDKVGIRPEFHHKEVAIGQHEVNFRYSDALRTADNLVTFKTVVRHVAAEAGLIATFMPKPIEGENGSGMHMNMSLLKAGENAFIAQGGDPLSEEGMYFMGGIMKYLPEITSILNPTVNSYRRLVPGYEAPIIQAWGVENRSAVIRVPRGGNPAATRIELRSADPSANPYLAEAVLLAAGLRGIKDNISPGKPYQGNTYTLTRSELKEKGFNLLPSSLGEALELTRKSELVREVFGEKTFNSYISRLEKDVERFRLHVSQLQRDMYLNV